MGAPRNPKKLPVFDFRPTFVTLRPWKRTHSAASDSGSTPWRAKSDFLSVAGTALALWLVRERDIERQPTASQPQPEALPEQAPA